MTAPWIYGTIQAMKFAVLVGLLAGCVAVAEAGQAGRPTQAATAIDHLEKALAGSEAEPESNLRAALARMYVRTSAFDKAIPILRDLVVRERGWQDGVALLTEAYTGAGKNLDAIAWLEEAVD